MTRQNETSYRKKGLSVFLTVIMILSVVAMSATFVGTVAADAPTIENSGEPDDLIANQTEEDWNLTQNENITILPDDDDNVTLTVDLSNATDHGVDFTDYDDVVVDNNESHDSTYTLDLDSNELEVEFEPDSDDFDITSLEVTNISTVGATAGDDIVLGLEAEEDGDVSTTVTGSFDITAADEDNVVSAPVAYIDGDDNTIIETVFDEGDLNSVVWDEDNVTVLNRTGEEVDDANVDVDVENNRVNVTVSDEELTADSPQGPVVELLGEEHSVTTTSTTIDHTGEVHGEEFAGESIALHTGDANDWIEIIDPDGDRERSTGDNSKVRVLETDRDWADEDINITFLDSNDEQVNVTLRDFGDLEIDIEDPEDGDTSIEGEVTADRVADRNVDVIVQYEGNDTVAATDYGATYDSEGVYEFDFEELSIDDYTVTAIDAGTNIDASEDVSLAEPPEVDAEVEFGELTDAAEGDIVEIELLFEDAEDFGDEDIIVWINESDYNANLTLETGEFENDSATLYWNTYQAGNAEDAWSTSDDDNLSVVDVKETNIEWDDDFRLNPAGYTLSLFQDGSADNVVDTDAVTVTERETGDATTYIAPTDADEDGLEHLLDNATAADTVAEDDLLIVEQEVTGIFGSAVDEDGNLDLASIGIEVNVTDTDIPAYANPDELDESDIDTYFDADDGLVYFVIEVDADGLEDGDTAEFEYTFNVTDENVYIDEDDEESASAVYTATERISELGTVEEPYQVTPTADAEIRGDSTLAPGSEITVAVSKSGVFSDSNSSIVIQDDRTWVSTYNFSDREVGEEFVITVEGEDTDAIFADTPEWETQTTEDQLQAIVDELTDLLDVEQDELVSTVEQLIEDADDAEELAAQVEQLQAQLSDAQEDAQTWETLYDGAVEDLEQAEADLEQAQDDLEQAESDLSDAQDEIDSLESDLSDAEDEIADLEDQIDDLQADDDDGVPGFGPIAALFALLAGGALVARRRL